MIRIARSLWTTIVLTTSRILYPPDKRNVRHVRIVGVEVLVMANEDVGREIAFLGCYEERDSTCLANLIAETDVCFDIGANTGFYTMLMANRARAGEVHSFEPLPLNWHLLSAGTILNAFRHVRANNLALGNQIGRIEFSESRDTAYSSILDVSRRGEAAKVSVQMETLDAYMARNNVPRIDVVKIDVEGAEALVIEGGRGVFSDLERQPRVAMIELFSPNLRGYGKSIAEIVGLMGAVGYDAFIVVPNGALVPLEERHWDRNYNVFFVSRARGGSIRRCAA